MIGKLIMCFRDKVNWEDLRWGFRYGFFLQRGRRMDIEDNVGDDSYMVLFLFKDMFEKNYKKNIYKFRIKKQI